MVISLLFSGLISVLLLWPQNRGDQESQSTASDHGSPNKKFKTGQKGKRGRRLSHKCDTSSFKSSSVILLCYRSCGVKIWVQITLIKYHPVNLHMRFTTLAVSDP